MIERSFFGQQRERFASVTDASVVEAVPLGLLIISILAIGIYPSLLTEVFELGVQPLVDGLNGVVR